MLNTYSSKFKIVPTIPKQGVSSWATATGHFVSACRWWNEKHTIKKTWTQFKSHFAAACCQHKQMQGESADQLDTTPQMPELPTIKIKWLKQLLEHYPILQQQPQRFEVL
jgi:hypothetical protein